MPPNIPPQLASLLTWRGKSPAREPANVAVLLRELTDVVSGLALHPRRGPIVTGSLPWQRAANREWNELDDAALARRLDERFGWSPSTPIVRRGLELFLQARAALPVTPPAKLVVPRTVGEHALDAYCESLIAAGRSYDRGDWTREEYDRARAHLRAMIAAMVAGPPKPDQP